MDVVAVCAFTDVYSEPTQSAFTDVYSEPTQNIL